MATADSSPKLCECGCGLPAPIAKSAIRRDGYAQGQPKRFRKGHYARTIYGSPSERFWAKVDRRGPDECWTWLAFTDHGYGKFMAVKGDCGYAHRWSYEAAKGPIPQGLHVDHLCRNRSCVNPAHLEAVTPRENAMRGIGFCAVHAKTTHCPQGHPYDVLNTAFHNGKRHCRTCARAHNRNTVLRRSRERAMRRLAKKGQAA